MDADAPTKDPSRTAWIGAEMAGSREWIYEFTGRDLDELDAAMRATKDLAITDIRDREFALPTLGALLKDIRDEVLHGRGFVLMRGLPVDSCSLEEAARLYWGIGAHIGKAVSQNAMGHLLGHVYDLGRDAKQPEVRVYQTRERQYYHADSCDIVGLLCVRPAKAGGHSSIVSSVTLYNEMMARRPDLAQLLTKPVAVDRRGEVPEGRKPYYMIPVFNLHAGLVSTYYVRRYIESAQRFADAPRLTDKHREAFDLLDALAEDKRLHLEMAFKPGDIQLLHNHAILHDRTAYEDWPDPQRRRHLLRLWLCPPNGRPLPPAYADRWGSVEIGNRGGIVVPGAKLNVPLEPV